MNTSPTTISAPVVWVVTSEQYGQTRVLAVLESKTAAKKLARRMNHAARPEEPEDIYFAGTLPVVTADTRQVSTMWRTAHILDDGSQTAGSKRYVRHWPFDSVDGTVDATWRWARAPRYNGAGGRLDVYGTDHDKVAALYIERRNALRDDDALRAEEYAGDWVAQGF